jgi:hypothetical protein
MLYIVRMLNVGSDVEVAIARFGASVLVFSHMIFQYLIVASSCLVI